MLTIISPAKTLDMKAETNSQVKSQPALLDKSRKLIALLKKKKAEELSQLMGISPKLAQLNFERFQEWVTPHVIEKSRPAVFAFRGEVFTGLNIDTFSEVDLTYTQNHLRILSGLYGLLRPMDSIMAYRLEMGTKLSVGQKKNLYEFWGDEITGQLNKALKADKSGIVVNLASNEYFKSIHAKKLNAWIITPVFKDNKNGQYKVISFFAKKARGHMLRFILKNKLSKPEDLKHFEEDGYYFNDSLSNQNTFTFTRG
ncbi:MAG: peroxide stress protein YaaA [Bacteroidales bacterium]|nr:peroxide stress protein YaaA [Bacteroidales bacterium]